MKKYSESNSCGPTGRMRGIGRQEPESPAGNMSAIINEGRWPVIVFILWMAVLPSCRSPLKDKDSRANTADTAATEQEALLFLSGTNDRMFMDSLRYLMDVTPLAGFKNYEKMYNGPFNTPFPAYRSCTVGKMDKLYAPQWALLDDSLYLYAVDYDVRAVVEPGMSRDLNRLIEKLVGKKFIRDKRCRGLPLDSLSDGLLSASWFSGVLRIKLPNETQIWGESLEDLFWKDKEWVNLPFGN